MAPPPPSPPAPTGCDSGSLNSGTRWNRLFRVRRAIAAGLRAAVLSLPFLLVSCTGGDEYTRDGRIIIDYWEKWQGFERDAMAAVVDKYNASQDKVFVRYVSQSQIDRKLLLATAGGNPPDVAGFWSHTIMAYAEKGALMPLDRLMERDGIRHEDYLPAVIDGCEYRGVTWGLPSTPATIALHYNKKLFREAGLDPERPPRTLQELEEYARKLTKRDASGKIVQLGFSPSDPGWWSPMWGYFFGADLVDEDARHIMLNSPEGLEAYTWLARFMEEYGRADVRQFEAAAGQFASADNTFMSGRLAMQIQGVWMSSFIDQFAPDLEWGVAPFPVPFDSEHGMTIIECDMLVIPKGASHVEEAWDFIKFTQRPENMELLCLGQRKFSPLVTVNEEFHEKHPNPYIRVFRELAESPDARAVPKMPVWDEYRSELGMTFEEVWIRGTAPAVALQRLEQRIQSRLDRANAAWDRVAEARQREWAEQ
jgi:multiple sugar transport system substrate-binding protein